MSARTWEVAEVLDRAGVGYRVKQRSYGTVYQLDRCLTSPDHRDGACITEFAIRAVDYTCHHDRCQGRGWPDARAELRIDDWLKAKNPRFVLSVSKPGGSLLKGFLRHAGRFLRRFLRTRQKPTDGAIQGTTRFLRIMRFLRKKPRLTT